ncbi:MAG: LysR family transcriptional regulator [Pseudonocardiales bacterium]|nr:LysR family transcriptional regulator [Pseudonocardiales bacterium]
MELRDLRYLEVLAAELHFGRAAMRLHMTQPALSQSLARLEKEIGCPLLQRDPRGASLTDAGRVLLSETQDVLKSMDHACELSRRAGRGDMGSVTVGFVDAAVFDILPPLLLGYRQRFPEVSVTARQLKSAELAERVETGQLDLAFLRREAAIPGVEYRTIRTERLAVAVNRNHPLAQARDVAVRDLADEDFIIPAMDGAPSLHALWRDICFAAGFAPRIAAHTISIQVLIELVAHDLGVAFVVDSWGAKSNPQVVVKELRDVEEFLELAVGFRPKQIPVPAKNLLDMALEMAGSTKRDSDTV